MTPQQGLADDHRDFDLEKSHEYFTLNRTPQFLKDIQLIKSFVVSGSLLDVGSSYGIFLDIASRAGFRVRGIEPGEQAVSMSRSRHPDIPVDNTDFQSADIPQCSYDVVTFWSVLEHTVDPRAALLRANAVLKEGGLIALRVPNFKSLLAGAVLATHRLSLGRLDGPSRSLCQMDYAYKHFYIFTRTTLTRLLEDTGFQVTDHYLENALKPELLELRAAISDKTGDVRFLRSRLVRGAVKLVLKGAETLKLQDEMVIFARKK